jgi:surface polysaccharide O-acyltransferase-like enzyme
LGRLPIVLLFYEVWYFAVLVGVALSDGSARGKRIARLVAALTVITMILAFRGQLT